MSGALSRRTLLKGAVVLMQPLVRHALTAC
jgi:hypothetical protein